MMIKRWQVQSPSAFIFGSIKAQPLPGTLMGGILRVEAAGLATTVDHKSDGQLLPKEKLIYFQKL